jgi:superfamily II DNA or RNA helicase
VPLVLETPVRLRLPKAWEGSSVEEEIAEKFGYEDLRATFEWRRWLAVQRNDDYWLRTEQDKPRPRQRNWLVLKEGRDALDAKVAELEAARSKTALFRDDKGLYTYSGLGPQLAEDYGEKIVRAYQLPELDPIGWEWAPDFEDRWYQAEARDLLIPKGHGGVELATGLGKSHIVALLLKNTGLPGIVVAPTLSIAEQLLDDLRKRFGKKRVGQFFDSKKQSDRHIVVAVSASLLRVQRGTDDWKNLATKSVLIGDESHMLPADTLSTVVLGMLGRVPYRFFLSGTQIRTDGLDLVLQGIVGDIVLRMNVRQGIEGGFLSPLRFFQFDIGSDKNFTSPDPMKMTSIHLYENEKVYQHAADLARKAAARGRRVLVLVDEFEQFSRLMKIGKLDIPTKFAHGGVDKKTKKKVPQEHWKSNPGELVKAFDRGEFPCLVGTSCIGMGTDIKSASFIIDLVGLKAEIRLRQNAGRGTRLFPGKTDCVYVDYNVFNVDTLAKHAAARAKVFEDIYGPITYKRA